MLTETPPTGIPDPSAAPPKMKDLDTFMSRARDRYSWSFAEDADDRKDAEQDTDFVGGDQWEKKAFAARKKAKRPILSWNRLQTFVAQVVNDGRENKPSIRVSPMDGGKKHTADFYQTRIRQLEYETDADIAYDTVREQQVVSGRGFIRVSTAWKSEKSWDLKITIEPIDNQFSVLFEPTATRYIGDDAAWCFVFSSLSKASYERKYGKSTAAASSNYFSDQENPAPDW